MKMLLKKLNKKQLIRTLEEQEGLSLRANPTGQEQYQHVDPETGLAYTTEYNPTRIDLVPTDTDWGGYSSARAHLPKITKGDILRMYETGESIILDGDPIIF